MFVDSATRGDKSAALFLGAVDDVLGKVSEGILFLVTEHILEA